MVIDQEERMGIRGCVSIEINESMYSTPVPMIGLYIAGASMVCFLAMLYDILSVFCHRKRWLPCKFFSLNSVTLTLLGIAAKLPVDLTTAMPSAIDQMSKLTGTTIICTSMAFLLPSLGTNQSSECLTNMAALSILVVTVIVNICIQISTGVIFLFIIEHMIIMCCLTLFLILMWSSAVESNRQKAVDLNSNKKFLTKCQGSMMHRLKLVYMYGYNNSPQFFLCTYLTRDVICLLCVVCLVVIMQAACRSLSLVYCPGSSDYNWSIWIIVLCQVLTIMLGSFATIFRWLNLYFSKYAFGRGEEHAEVIDEIRMNPLLLMRTSLWDRCIRVGQNIIWRVFIMVYLVLAPLEKLPRALVSFYFKPKPKFEGNEEAAEEYKDLFYHSEYRLVDEWSLDISIKELTRWIKVSKSASLKYLPQLLSKTLPSSRPYDHTDMEFKDQQDSITVSSLSLVLLVRIAQVSLPPELTESLLLAYTECHEIIGFIHNRINEVNFENQKISMHADAVWRGKGFGSLLPERYRIDSGQTDKAGLLDCALVIIRVLQNDFPHQGSYVMLNVKAISNFVTRQNYSCIEDLYNYIEQIFVDMVHIYFAQLPHAIFKDVNDSPVEEFEGRTRNAIRFLCQLESLEDQIQWSFPVGTNILRLITSELVSRV
ncbi:transmembrane protein [Thalictrum thalictroides]|uniref:Transmembrane protein n=1 Tax=Thalictrum thalictroides TaxID=46969 RepID=A0A7J6V3J7_THATH|nr:transmembrane protein [Thalictrum thalictroides]